MKLRLIREQLLKYSPLLQYSNLRAAGLILGGLCLHFPQMANAQLIQATPNYIELSGLSPYTHYKTFNTDHFEMIFPENLFHFTKIAAQELEHAHAILSPILKWEPRSRTTILVTDNQDAANGFTSPALRIGIVLIATPPDPWFSTSYEENWIKLLVFHEYTHMLNIDATTSWMEVLRWYFGDIIRPNGLWPVWMLEGLAVYFETKTSLLGRGRSPYYESILRAYVNEKKLNAHQDFGMTLDRVNGDYPIFPGGETPYLFGYHLWQELELSQPDGDQVVGDYSIHSSHRVPYFINGNLKNLTHLRWKDLWKRFVERTEDRMQAQISAVKSEGETHHQPVTNAKYSALGGIYSPDGQWLAWNETNLHLPHSGLFYQNLKTGEIKRADDKSLGVSLSFSPDSRWLLYSAQRTSNSYNLFSELCAFDLQTGKTFLLTSGQRAKDPSFSADGKKIVFLQTKDATNHVAMAPFILEGSTPKLGPIEIAYSPTEFAILGSPRFLDSSSEEVVFSLQELGNAFSDLAVIHLTEKSNSGAAKILFHDGHFNRYPFPSPQGVYFTSEKTGIENIYLLPKSLSAPQPVTHVITGVQLPFTSPQGEVLGSLMTSMGPEIVKFDSTTPLSPTQKIAPAIPSAPTSYPAALAPGKPLLIAENQVQNYSPWASLIPRQWAPVGLVTYDTTAGLQMLGEVIGFDSTGHHEYAATVSENFKTATTDANLNYMYYGFRPKITLSASAATTDIATDPSQAQYRHTDEIATLLEYPFFFTYSTLRPDFWAFLDWNRIYNIQNGQPAGTSLYEYSHPITPGLGASVTYTQLEQSVLAYNVPESGFQASAAIEANYNESIQPYFKYLGSITSFHLLGEHFILQPKLRYVSSTTNLGTFNSSVLLENGTQTAFDQLGIRGYPTALYLARSAGIGSLDVHFPIAKLFYGPGTCPTFIKQLHGFVFGELGVIPNGSDPYTFPAAGGGVSLDTTLFVRLPITFTLQAQEGLKTNLGGGFQTIFGITSIPVLY